MGESVIRSFLRRTLLAAVALAAAAATLGIGALAPRNVVAAGPYVEGIDVSRWQGAPNWAQVKDAGVRFVIAKATQGTSWVDPEWARNRERLRANAIPFSAYHFAEPDATPGDAVAEADHFVNTARLDRRNLLPVLDLERHNDMTVAQLREWVAAWLARVERRLGVKPMIYVSPSFWVERMGNTTWFADRGYRLWIAHWNVDTPTLPANNWGGRGWTLWQYAVQCCVPGISGKVDRDRYNGNRLAPIRIRNNR
jgi:lysozyme